MTVTPQAGNAPAWPNVYNAPQLGVINTSLLVALGPAMLAALAPQQRTLPASTAHVLTPQPNVTTLLGELRPSTLVG